MATDTNNNDKGQKQSDTPNWWQRTFGVVKKDANNNVIYLKDPDGNEIGRLGKQVAGLTLVAVTITAMLAVIAIWPDKLPPANQGASTKYYYKPFAVTYAGVGGVRPDSAVMSIPKNIFKPKRDTTKAGKDSANTGSSDTTVAGSDTTVDIPQTVDSLMTAAAQLAESDTAKTKTKAKGDTSVLAKLKVAKSSKDCIIDLNTLILLLVALSGFLGNMIHIGASFTNFVGAGKFKRSWVLWYFVKPFTAAALAVGVYIIFRAGFLNAGEAVASVNLYGVVALAVLAGLYTDMATQKLKEVFAVVFQSSTTRPDPLSYPPVKITDVEPNPLPLNVDTRLIVSGIGFADRKFTVKIGTVEVKDVSIRPNALLFNYKATGKDPELVLYDEKGVEVLQYNIKTADAPADPAQPPAAPTVSDISAAPLTVNTEATVTVTGTNLTAAGIKVAIADPAGTSTAIADTALTKTDTAITFGYTPATAGDYAITVSDSAGTALKQQVVTVA